MALPVYCKTLDSKYDVYLASRHIDALTFNRIIDTGWDNLTEFQREIVTKVCERLAIFETDYDDVVNSVINSYSINGVSLDLSVNTNNITNQNGVIIKKSDYELLKSSGLCTRLI